MLAHDHSPVRFLDDSVHKFSRAFLLCYEFVQFLTPSKNLTDPSTFIWGASWSLYQCILQKCFSKSSNFATVFIQSHFTPSPMSICTSQSLFTTYLVINRHCHVQKDIEIRADELGISVYFKINFLKIVLSQKKFLVMEKMFKF
jgi:hypothetical protein